MLAACVVPWTLHEKLTTLWSAVDETLADPLPSRGLLNGFNLNSSTQIGFFTYTIQTSFMSLVATAAAVFR